MTGPTRQGRASPDVAAGGVRGRRTLVAASLALPVLVGAAPADAQQPAPPASGGEPSADSTAAADSVPEPDSAAARRERPANSHPFDGWDAVALPFRVATFPLDLLGDGIHLLLDAAADPSVETPGLVRAYRDVRRWGLRPDVGSLGPRSGPAAELTFDRFEPLYLRSGISWREYQAHEAGLRWSDSTGVVEVAGGFDRDTEPHFWGIGADSPAAAETSYLRDRVYGRVAGTLGTPGPVELALGAGYEENRVDRGFDDAVPALQDRFAPEALFGLGPEKTRFFRGRLSAELDMVEMDGLSKRGFGLEVASSLYRGAGPTEADFHRFRGSARAFLPVSRRHIVAFRVASEVNRPDSGRGVPFFYLAELGGDPGGRAYSNQRFRSRDMVALTAEWRYEVWRELLDRMRLEGFVFADEGAVARRLDEVSSSDWRPSFGGGLRLVSPGGEVGRVYWATGEEGSRVALDVGASF